MDGAQQLAQPTNKLVGWVHRAGGFLVAVREELNRVTWPTRPELVKATRMIIKRVIVVSGYPALPRSVLLFLVFILVNHRQIL